jgi:hypothetical protein
MHLFKSKTFLALLLSLICLISGLVIYANWRGEDLFLHSILIKIGLFDTLQFPNSWKALNWIPEWVKFSLPDGLLMLALGLTIASIWSFRWQNPSVVWYGIAWVSGFLFEILQIIETVPGTFDWLDMLFIFGGGVIPLLAFRNQKDK